MTDDTQDGTARVPRVKICGHTSAADLRASLAAGADAVGVIADVSVDTPREVAVGRANELLDAVPPLATGVLVTMPDDVARAVELVGRTSPDAIQVHGTLAPDEVGELRDRVHVDVIAAVEATTEHVDAYADAADAVLVDTPAADGGGGTGETHDWERTAGATEHLVVPTILAGGLTPANVAHAIGVAGPYGVDVASGVESVGGEKDHDAVRAFVREARGTGAVDSDEERAPSAEGSR